VAKSNILTPPSGKETVAESVSCAKSTSSRFHLLRKLTWTSVLAIVIAAVSLITLYWFDQLAEHRAGAEQENEKITLRLAQQYHSALTRYIAEMSGLPVEHLGGHQSVAAMDVLVESYLASPVVKI
jgi:hypothetical protein